MKTSIFLLLSLNNFLDILQKEAFKVNRIHIITPIENLEYTEEQLREFLGFDIQVIISKNVMFSIVVEHSFKIK